MLQKIEALLRKAESTPYEEEAAIYYEKAQELMLRYAISEEELWREDPSKAQQVIVTAIEIRGGDTKIDKHVMLTAIAKANRCKAWRLSKYNVPFIVHVAGFPSDIAYVEALYNSLLTQMELPMAEAMRELMPLPPRDAMAFRFSFTQGYCSRIATRFKEMEEKEESTGTDLIDLRKTKVDRYLENEGYSFQSDVQKRKVDFDPRGYTSGKEAAENVDLSESKRLGNQKELEE